MKKFIKIFTAAVAIILILLVSLPFLFKDKIKAKIDEAIASAVNADVYYDYDKISASIFKRFPDISITLGDFGVVNRAPFTGDTLAAIGSLQVDFNLKSVIFDENPTLTGIHLDRAKLNVKVLADGAANYDITFPEEEAIQEDTTGTGDLQIAIDQLEISNSSMIYEDKSLNFYTDLRDLNLDGRGDFTLDIYDLKGLLSGTIHSMIYEDVNYLSNKKVLADAVVNINMPEFKFTFKENLIKVNDFGFIFDGFIAMPEDDIEMDFSVAAEDNSFKSLLSLVPGIYTESFEGIQTSGTLDFASNVKGIYSDTSMPAFDLMLKVSEGMFQYPDLPDAVRDINVDLLIENKDGNIDNTSLDIKTFNLAFGKNPLSGRMKIANLVTYDIDAFLKGSINLADMTSMFPLEGMTLKGVFSTDITASGRYDSLTNTIPKINANMNLKDGYIKSSDFPSALEQISLTANILNQSGKMAETTFDMSDFKMLLDGEEVIAKLKVSNLNDYTWDAFVQGNLDLGKLMKIYPIEGTTLDGHIYAELETKGKMSDLEAKRYANLPTKGLAVIDNLTYQSTDLPQGFKIEKAETSFNPSEITLTQFDAQAGESKFSMTGALSNYLPYLLGENEVLVGKVNFNSKRFNANEWMTETEVVDTTSSEPLSVIEIPKNVDFTFNAAIDEVIYDNLNLKSVKGQIIAKDGVLRFNDTGMKLLGGDMNLSGTYDTRDMSDPKFDMTFKLKEISFKESFNSFVTIQTLAPIAQHIAGNFSTTFKLGGKLGQDMMPIPSSLDGSGLINIAKAAYENSQLLSGLTSVTSLNDANSVSIKDLVLSASITDGRFSVKPFDVNIGSYKTNISGSTGLDGSLQYQLKMDVPAGKLGTQINDLIAGISGQASSGSSIIPLNIALTGTYDKPKFGLNSNKSVTGQVQNAIQSRVESEKEQAVEKIENIADSLKTDLKAKQDSLKKVIEARAKAKEDSLKKAAEEAKKKLEEEAKKKALELLRKRGGGE